MEKRPNGKLNLPVEPHHNGFAERSDHIMAKLIVILFLVLSPSAFAQKVMNFDKVLNYDDSDIVIQPPPGQTWTLLRGSFQVKTPIQGVGVTIYEQEGDAEGLCTNLIRADLSSNVWVPIVGGYVAHPYWGYLRGLDEPIVLVYPNRLVIHLSALTQSVQTWTRFTIQ